MTLITTATTEDEKQAVFNLRYRVWIEELGRIDPFAEAKSQTIVETADTDAILYQVHDADTLVGTVRVEIGKGGDPGEAFISRLAVVPTLRGSPVVVTLLVRLYHDLLDLGLTRASLRCRPELVKLYESLGLRVAGPAILDPVAGPLFPMTTRLEDAARHGRVLARAARRQALAAA